MRVNSHVRFNSRGEVERLLPMLIEIVFRGFGRLMPKMRKARTAFKPHTREAISVPAKIVVKFKPYGELASLPQEEEDD